MAPWRRKGGALPHARSSRHVFAAATTSFVAIAAALCSTAAPLLASASGAPRAPPMFDDPRRAEIEERNLDFDGLVSLPDDLSQHDPQGYRGAEEPPIPEFEEWETASAMLDAITEEDMLEREIWELENGGGGGGGGGGGFGVGPQGGYGAEEDAGALPPPLTGPEKWEEWASLEDTPAAPIMASAAGQDLSFHLAFATPFLRFNIKDVLYELEGEPGIDLTMEAFNKRLVEHALNTRAYVLEEELAKDPDHDDLAYVPFSARAFQVFSTYQKHWPELAYSSPQSAALRVLVRLWKTAIREYDHIFAGGMHRPLTDMELRVWASVHYNNTEHVFHDHTGSRVCGIYYAQVPEGSGVIEFADPRGLGTPFASMTIMPHEGDFIIFPPFVAHRVHMSRNDPAIPRVSYSFNEATSGRGDEAFYASLGATAQGGPHYQDYKWSVGQDAHFGFPPGYHHG